ncbi:RNA recognition motif domain-containing protein [Dioscorea alata]|uniref:RNA recognition motif domain-containing protein n=2 Tax=Dioscorea alata TaxID=55571 RepID=A0ACB7VK24_DIOAL|nr:RNA recognition motif domain-containing protein [Dioscorea alata]KAH7674443.1 RNA recognition motif domain-containing protein [Dioscorea alata]
MMRDKDEPSAVRVYTVCDESRYLIVRNVPALGCGDELCNLFRSYGEVEECKPMDAEDCEAFTDVYWIKFLQVSSARIAKRKLDESVFLGNRLHVSYAPEFESPSDTKEKLEGRKKEVINRVKSSRDNSGQHWRRETAMSSRTPNAENSIKTHVSSNKDYFSSSSMNVTVQLVRDKLEKIQSSSDCLQAEPSSKRPRIDNRRRI